jgi:PPOX class probable F420-dependent enzyme
MQIPESHRDIFDKRSFAHVATVNSDGKPQVSPVWVEYDGTYILVNTARGRKKDRNMSDNPQIALSVQDPDNPYRYVGVQGHIEEVTENGAIEHINKLSHKYNGRDYPNLKPGETRVIYKIVPDRVTAMG